MKKIFKAVTVILLSFFLLLTVLNPDKYVNSALDGIKLWALVVLPALLPFFFITALLSKLGLTDFLAKTLKKPCAKLFRSGGYCAYVFCMSVLSGYPVGAKIIADLSKNGLVGQDEATRLSCLCSTSGPLFIVGSVGYGMFHDKNVGFCIIIAHVLSAVFCGLFFRFYGKDNPNKNFLLNKTAVGNVLYDCVYSSVISVLIVGGFICVFSTFITAFKSVNFFLPITALFKNLIPKDLLSAFLYGFIECTTGCKMLALCDLSTYSVAFTSALISLGGLSVWAQSIAFLSSANVNVKVFCLSKTVQAVIAFLLSLILFPLFV